MIEDDPFLLTRLSPTSTGLPKTVWAMVGDGDGSVPRILVGVEGRAADPATVILWPEPWLVAGDLDPEDRQAVIGWAERHRDALLRHWHGETDSLDLAEAVAPAVGSR